MQTFAFLFRSDATLDPDALARRNAAARAWALARQRDGSLRHASPLEDGGFAVARGFAAPIAHAEVAAVLVIEANDLTSAVELAKQHPGLAFGTRIDVRPVKIVAPSATS